MAPHGLVTVLVTIVAWLSATVVDAGPAALAGAAGATAGALAADALVRLLDRRPWRSPELRLPTVAGVVAALVWAGHLAALAFVGVEWLPELWAGVVVLSALTAAMLGHLATGVGSRNENDVVREPRATSPRVRSHSAERPGQP